VILEPVYGTEADQALKNLEGSTDPRELHIYEAVCDALDLICDHGDLAEARRQQLRTSRGDAVWRVQVRGTTWVILWWPAETEARIYYIGPG
jgi:hypothetical protein